MSIHIEECMEIGGTDKHKFWQSHMESWKQSGKTQSHYCRDNGLGIKVFGYWKRKLCSKRASAAGFVPVSIKRPYPASANTGASLRVIVGNGYGIDVGDGFNPDTLRRLMDTLGQRA